MIKMSGLQEYIAKHGKHFTEKLAYKAARKFWSASDIYSILQKKVYYNVSGYTLGDIVFVFNSVSDKRNDRYFRRNHVIKLLGDVNAENVFEAWRKYHAEKDFDFTPYI